ncbi:granzyme G-like, partial [Colossoma macropomum]|uniref:granzyme G-like n=1 Tax=Colossoma macropomum TaxID=42526 RepID=UPI001864DF29
ILLLAALLPHLTSVVVGIINGTEAKPHSRPYRVSRQKKGKHICGGFLVSEEFVMMAAHSSFASEVCLREEFEGNSNDSPTQIIILSQLRGKAKKSKTVKWISIPKTKEGIKANSVCSVAGWGRTGSFKSGSNHLMEAKKKCKKLWENLLTPRMICALHPGGSCRRDSGGPLVCGNTAMGIVSFGQRNKCDAPMKPKIFAKISAFLPWIKSIIRKV